MNPRGCSFGGNGRRLRRRRSAVALAALTGLNAELYGALIDADDVVGQGDGTRERYTELGNRICELNEQYDWYDYSLCGEAP